MVRSIKRITKKLQWAKHRDNLWVFFVVGLILVLFSLIYLWVQYQSIQYLYPFFSKQTDLYFAMNKTDLITTGANIDYSTTFPQNSSVNQDFIEDFLALVAEIPQQKTRVGGGIIDGKTFYYLRLAKNSQYSDGDVITSRNGVQWDLAKIREKNTDLLVFTREETRFETDIRITKAKELFSIERTQNTILVGYSQFSPKNELYFRMNDDEGVLIFQAKTPKISFSVLHSLDQVSGMMGLSLQTLEKASLWPDTNFPLTLGELTLISGDEQAFLENPFQTDLNWVWKGNEQDFESLTSTILLILAEKYPTSVVTDLPDGSSILEIQRITDIFITDSSDTNSLYTYPGGQLYIERKGNEMIVLHNADEFPSEMIDNNCLVEQPVLAGYSMPVDNVDSLWTKQLFSYSSQEIALCFSTK